MEQITESEFKALISLLDDPDEEVIFHVSNRLKDLGIKGVDKLEDAWEYAQDDLTQRRIEDLIKDIQFGRLKQELQLWKEKDSEDLLLGAILVAKYRYPELDESQIYKVIDKLHQAIWIEMNNGLTPLEEINVFNEVFYKLSGFIGEQEGYNNPELGYINKVLALKKGNSHLLGIIYLTLCKELNIPVYGIKLPYYFVLAYIKTDFADINLFMKSDISFYINPLSEGSVFQAKQIEDYLAQMKISAKEKHFLPATNVEIIAALVYHLLMCYEQNGEKQEAEHLKELYDILVGK